MVKRFAPDRTRIDPEKLAAWLEEKWVGEKLCPICKSNDWNISERALELRELTAHFLLHSPSPKIVAMLQCSVCGNTIFINPFIANLFEDEKEHLLASVSNGESQT